MRGTQAGTDIFTVDKLPAYTRKDTGVRANLMDETITKVRDLEDFKAGDWLCVRQYIKRGSAESCATNLRKRYGDLDVKLGPITDDESEHGVFVRKADAPI